MYCNLVDNTNNIMNDGSFDLHSEQFPSFSKLVSLLMDQFSNQSLVTGISLTTSTALYYLYRTVRVWSVECGVWRMGIQNEGHETFVLFLILFVRER